MNPAAKKVRIIFHLVELDFLPFEGSNVLSSKFREVHTAERRSKAAPCRILSSQLMLIMAIFRSVAEALDNLEDLSSEAAIPVLTRPFARRMACGRCKTTYGI